MVRKSRGLAKERTWRIRCARKEGRNVRNLCDELDRKSFGGYGSYVGLSVVMLPEPLIVKTSLHSAASHKFSV